MIFAVLEQERFNSDTKIVEQIGILLSDTLAIEKKQALNYVDQISLFVKIIDTHKSNSQIVVKYNKIIRIIRDAEEKNNSVGVVL